MAKGRRVNVGINDGDFQDPSNDEDDDLVTIDSPRVGGVIGQEVWTGISCDGKRSQETEYHFCETTTRLSCRVEDRIVHVEWTIGELKIGAREEPRFVNYMDQVDPYFTGGHRPVFRLQNIQFCRR